MEGRGRKRERCRRIVQYIFFLFRLAMSRWPGVCASAVGGPRQRPADGLRSGDWPKPRICGFAECGSPSDSQLRISRSVCIRYTVPYLCKEERGLVMI